jgi:hypothetical protein
MSVTDFTNLSISPISQTDTFTNFTKLPIELRLIVWDLTFERGKSVHRRRDIGIFPGASGHLRVMGGVMPLALHFNHESRRETLRHYRLLFDCPPSPNFTISKPFYYCPQLDIISLGQCAIKARSPQTKNPVWKDLHDLRPFLQAEFDKIETLALSGNYTFFRAFGAQPGQQLVTPGVDGDNIFFRRDFKECLLEIFKNLTFLNVGDISMHTRPNVPSFALRWQSLERPNIEPLRAYYRRQQLLDPSFSMPMIRFAPSRDEHAVDFMSQWPPERQTRAGDLDVFTEISKEVVEAHRLASVAAQAERYAQGPHEDHTGDTHHPPR